MTRLSALLACTALTGVLSAQPLMQFSNVPANQLYDWFIVINPGTSDPTPNGPNQTWNFTSATLQQAGYATFKSTTGTSYATAYPAATHVLELTATGLGVAGFMCFDVTSSGMDLIAQQLLPNPVETYTDYKQIMKFPFASGNPVYMDTYDNGGGSTSVTYTYAGYGLLNLGLWQYSNTIKQATSEGDIIFWTPTPFAPVVILAAGGTPMVLRPTAVGVAENDPLARVTIFPNPAEELLNVRGLPGSMPWAVVDALGRSMMSGVTGNAALEIPTGDLAPGVYRLMLTTSNGSVSKPFVRQ